MREVIQELVGPTSLRVVEDREVLQGMFVDILELKKDNTYLQEQLSQLMKSGGPLKKEIIDMVERKCLHLRMEADESSRSLTSKVSAVGERVKAIKSRVDATH